MGQEVSGIEILNAFLERMIREENERRIDTAKTVKGAKLDMAAAKHIIESYWNQIESTKPTYKGYINIAKSKLFIATYLRNEDNRQQLKPKKQIALLTDLAKAIILQNHFFDAEVLLQFILNIDPTNAFATEQLEKLNEKDKKHKKPATSKESGRYTTPRDEYYGYYIDELLKRVQEGQRSKAQELLERIIGEYKLTKEEVDDLLIKVKEAKAQVTSGKLLGEDGMEI